MKTFTDRLRRALDPDVALMTAMRGAIEARATQYALGRDVERWREGDPLKLLLAGYVGTRNTGADVRVEEMIRQIRHVVGEDEVECTVVSNDLKLSQGYFRRCRQVHLPAAYPKFLYDECARHHGVVACEGSMFKSKFSSALTTFMAGALGVANAEHKLSIGYGAEAGDMTADLERFVERACSRSLVFCRNEPSRRVLDRLGVRTTLGADTAWTFEPSTAEVGERLLREAGWDGRTPVLAVCPVNPYWWPVRPNLARAAANALAGEFESERYRAFYFHEWDSERAAKLDTYLGALAAAVDAFAREQSVFPILVGMEQLDRRACERLNTMLSRPAPLFVSDEHRMHDLVAVLRRCSGMLSSRYHAMVTSMPALVPSAGVTMDERIRNLMVDRSQPELFCEVDDPDLEDRALTMLRLLWTERERVQDGIARALPGQLALMGQMGVDFMDEVCRLYPEFPRRDLGRSPERHLPTLGRELERALELAA